MDAEQLLIKYIKFLEYKLHFDGHDLRDIRYEFALKINDELK